MSYIILHELGDFINIVVNEKGETLYFNTRKEAMNYGNNELNFKWKVVEWN